MAQAPHRSASGGPALIRLLARLTDVAPSEPRQSLPDRLSQWLNWTDAITLSTALKASPPAASAVQSAGKDAESMCARVRTALVSAMTATVAPDARRTGVVQSSAHGPSTTAAVDCVDFRQRYLSMQQAMEAEISRLRDRLRRMLAARAPELARLALLDASLEQALSARERTLLASIPALVGKHFERLREVEQQRLADAEASGGTPAVAPGAWLDMFRKDMQSVLLAELDVRFQPVEGLLAALRTC